MARSKLAKFAENKTFPHLFQLTFEEAQHFPLKGKWHQDFFKNTNPIVLELGCGKGEYTVGLGEKYPQKNFIGMDIKGARLWRGCKTVSENNMNNVAFIRTHIQNAGLYFAPEEVDEIWITFPDPQPKKENKRLTSPPFLSIYQHFLKTEGIVRLKTDDTDLYEYTKELVLNDKHELLFATDDLYKPGSEHLEVKEIQTYYERIWLDMGKKIKFICFKLHR